MSSDTSASSSRSLVLIASDAATFTFETETCCRESRDAFVIASENRFNASLGTPAATHVRRGITSALVQSRLTDGNPQ